MLAKTTAWSLCSEPGRAEKALALSASAELGLTMRGIIAAAVGAVRLAV